MPLRSLPPLGMGYSICCPWGWKFGRNIGFAVKKPEEPENKQKRRWLLQKKFLQQPLLTLECHGKGQQECSGNADYGEQTAATSPITGRTMPAATHWRRGRHSTTHRGPVVHTTAHGRSARGTAKSRPTGSSMMSSGATRATVSARSRHMSFLLKKSVGVLLNGKLPNISIIA